MTADRVRIGCAWLTIVAAGVVLLGWIFQQPGLVSWLPGSANTMKFNTSLCFIALGLVLLLAKRKGHWARRIRAGGIMFVLTVAGLTLLEYFCSCNFGIDQLVIQDVISPPQAGYPGRMSDQSAYTFLLLASTSACFQYRRHCWAITGQILLLIASWITLIGLCGYVLHIPAFYQFLERKSLIASNTVLTFLVVCLGLFCLAPNHGFIGVLMSQRSGGRLARLLMPWLILVPLGLHWLSNFLVFYGLLSTEVGDGFVALTTSSILLAVLGYAAHFLNHQDEELSQRLEDIQESNRRFRQIFMQSPFPMVLYRTDGKIIEFNQAWAVLSGYDVSEIPTIEAWCWAVYGEEIAPRVIELIRGMYALAAGENEHYGEFTFQTKSGRTLVWDFYTSGLGLDVDGWPMLLSTAVDVTERTLAERQLRDLSENLDHLVKLRTDELETIQEQLEKAQRVAGLGNWLYEVESQKIIWSQQMFRIFGMAPSSSPPTFEEHVAQIHPLDRDFWHTYVSTAMHDQKPYSMDFRCVWPDGSVHWVSAQGEVVTDEQGKTIRLFGTCLDITDRKQAELRLAEAEQRFRLLVEQSPGVVYVSPTAPTSEHSYISPQIQELIGVPQQDWSAGFFNTWKKYVYSEDLDWVLNAVKEAIRQNRSVNLEYRMVRADGQVIWVRDQGELFMDPVDGTLLIQGLAVDITALKHAEAALQKQIEDLDQRNREMQLLRQLSDFLQTCRGLDEAAKVITSYAPQLFPESSGQLCLTHPDHPEELVALLHWGSHLHTTPTFNRQDCWALRRGTPHLYSPKHLGMPITCHHLEPDDVDDLCMFCLPLTAFSEIIGHLCIESNYDKTRCSPNSRQLAETMTEQIALAIANLQLREALRQESLRDPLTGLYNRRYLHEFLAQEFARSERSYCPIGLLMIDIDHFKSFNDHFGHSIGDFVLQNVAQAITSHVRPSDVTCRYGGEEMIVVMPNTNLEAAQGRAEQLRLAVSQLRTDFQDQQFGGVTVSIGVAIHPDCGPDSDALLRAADNALYQAKNQGRNQVVLAANA